MTSGYSATGKRPAAMPPSRRITMESTHARTGRLMKKRSMAVIPYFVFGMQLGSCLN